MYSESRLRDARFFLANLARNQGARWFPQWHARRFDRACARQPGYPAGLATYFLRCVQEYAEALGVPAAERAGYLAGKHVLEYGPGHVRGVALILYAYGAESVTCVDRFRFLANERLQGAVFRAILGALPEPQRARAAGAFRVAGEAESGLAPDRFAYRLDPLGLAGVPDRFGLVLSRAVLEHVNDLPASLLDMRNALRPGGRAVHHVDLRSHGLDRFVELDFLTIPPGLYRAITSHRSMPNRLRLAAYLEAASRAGLRAEVRVIDACAPDVVERIRPHLPAAARAEPAAGLACRTLWLLLDKP